MSPSKQNAKIPVLSFFTGAGFLDIGFTRAGFDVVWHNEFWPEFARGFKYAYTGLTGKAEPQVVVDDITNLRDPQAILQGAFGKKGPPPVWGVIGGPPCPDFSVGGKNRGSDGENGILSRTYMQRIMELQPTFFLFENVPGLFRTEKHRRFLNELRQWAEQIYATDIKILNALEFGVPQDRERVFFIGVKREWLQANGKEPPLERYQPASFTGHWFPYPAPIYPEVKKEYNWPRKDAFGGQPIRPIAVPSELTVAYWLLDPTIETLPNQNEHFTAKSRKFTEVEEGDDRKKSFKRLHRFRYAPTSAYGNNEVHLHPTQPRRLTVREALRLQSVPDEYALPADMSLSDKFKTIGNGVPVRLAQTVASALRQFLTEK